MALRNKRKGILYLLGWGNPVKEFPEETQKNIAGEGNTPMPTSDGGRSSVPDINTFAPATKLTEIPPDFAVDYLTTLENLAAYNADFSYAVDNIIQLANTPHDIYFSDKVPEKKKKEMLAWIRENEGGWYMFSGGIRSLKADLLAQVAINGALSAECVPNERLDNIKQVVRVAPKNIRFVYDREKDMYFPYQKAPLNTTYRTPELPGLIKLNTSTYHYSALRRYHQTPYPVPPLITAIEGLVIQKKMSANFSFIMEKLGMLGFLSAKVSPPVKKKGESDEAYWQRCSDYLTNVVAPQMQKTLGKGFAVGYKDAHEFDLEGNNMNVQGAEGLVRIVQLMIFSGLKQDPNMLGYNFSTTETFGRVILTKMLSQIEDYQAVVDGFFEQLYLLALRLAGFSPGYVMVKSQQPLVSDRLREEQAEQVRIANVRAKGEIGMIGPDTAANELGYDKPYDKEKFDNLGNNPAAETEPKKDDETTGSDNGDDDADTEQNAALIDHLERRYRKHLPAYNYEHTCGYGSTITRENFMEYTDFGDPKLNAYMKGYFGAINKQYKKAIDGVIEKMKNRFESFNQATTIEKMQQELYLVLLQNWEPLFTSKITDDVKDNVEKIYSYFRKDKSVFDGSGSFNSKRKGEHLFDIPEPVFDLDDFRAMEFMEQFDSMYLGKFITDADLKKKFYAFLQDAYIDGGLPIGKGQQDINAYFKGFSRMLNLEAWKIRRIIDTSVNKIRNYGNINYMDQAGITRFEVIELVDNLTCEYCKHMNGQVFNMNSAVTKINKEIQAGPDQISTVSPFVTEMKVSEFKLLSNAELESGGYLSPPFHCHCRGRLVAVFD